MGTRVLTIRRGVQTSVFCAALAIASIFIPDHEGNSLKAYQDIGGVWTACGGVSRVPANSKYTKEQCKILTSTSIGKTMEQVAILVPSNISAKTLAADTSFAYNIGINGFKASRTLQYQNQGKWKEGCKAMLNWYKAGGIDCRIRSNGCYGVWTRRQDESNLCIEGAM